MPRPLFLLLILFFASASATETKSLGRLFHSKEERHTLDQLRHDNRPNTERHNSAVKAQYITLDGVVKRNDGKSTAWINGISHFDDEPSSVLIPSKPVQHGAATLQLSSGKNVSLKVGQTYDVTVNEVQEGSGMPSTRTVITNRPNVNKTPPH